MHGARASVLAPFLFKDEGINARIERQHQVLDLYHKLRDDLLDTLNNDNPELTSKGDAPPFGTLFAEVETIQQAYVDNRPVDLGENIACPPGSTWTYSARRLPSSMAR